MPEENRDKFTRIETTEDLQGLIKGDLVKIIFEHEPKWKYEEVVEWGAYHGTYFQGALEFLVPRDGKEGYLSMYRARKSAIEFREGAIVINEDKSVIKSFIPKNSKYQKLNETLRIAGLRQ